MLIVLIGIAFVLFGIIVLRLHAFLALIMASLVVGLLTPYETLIQFGIDAGMGEAEAITFADQSLGQRLANAFGNTAAKIGILIAMASIIGTCLLKSGAADRIIRSALRIFGEKRASLALLSSGFTLAIPVYFDTVFYLMIPLGKSLGIRFPRNYSLYVMSIIAGAAMAHSLVPPTPGPLFVAEEIGVDLGMMMLGGVIIGVISVTTGFLYAIWANRQWGVPIRDTDETNVAELISVSQKPVEELPPLGWSLLPVLLPIILISGNTILQVMQVDQGVDISSSWHQFLLSFAALVGNSNFALIISAVFALILLKKKVRDVKLFRKSVQDSLYNAGMIILITSAGGALGSMLQQTGIGIRIEELAYQFHLALLPLAFLITAMVRTAQGSATVAMITAIGVLGGIADADTLGFHPVYLALAVGCGSKVFPWMNDSGFWIISKMSGMVELETIRHFSFLLSLMGIAGLLATILFANLFPMI